jgi:septum formation protein
VRSNPRLGLGGCAVQGIEPEIVPSSFKENLPITDFPDVHEYPVATATHKAVEVYERLVVRVLLPIISFSPRTITRLIFSQTENPDDGPDLVIAADTVVLTRPPGSSDDGAPQEVLEKPRDKADNMRMLMDMNGGTCEVVTGVCVGECMESSEEQKMLSSFLFSGPQCIQF